MHKHITGGVLVFLLAAITSSSCPDDCSGSRGECVDDVCECGDGNRVDYGDDDCSASIYQTENYSWRFALSPDGSNPFYGHTVVNFGKLALLVDKTEVLVTLTLEKGAEACLLLELSESQSRNLPDPDLALECETFKPSIHSSDADAILGYSITSSPEVEDPEEEEDFVGATDDTTTSTQDTEDFSTAYESTNVTTVHVVINVPRSRPRLTMAVTVDAPSIETTLTTTGKIGSATSYSPSLARSIWMIVLISALVISLSMVLGTGIYHATRRRGPVHIPQEERRRQEEREDDQEEKRLRMLEQVNAAAPEILFSEVDAADVYGMVASTSAINLQGGDDPGPSGSHMTSACGGPVCVVCLGGFQPESTVRVLPCRHIFHSICIDQWARRHKTCPLCYTDLRGNEVTVCETIDPEVIGQTTIAREGEDGNGVDATNTEEGAAGEGEDPWEAVETQDSST